MKGGLVRLGEIKILRISHTNPTQCTMFYHFDLALIFFLAVFWPTRQNLNIKSALMGTFQSRVYLHLKSLKQHARQHIRARPHLLSRFMKSPHAFPTMENVKRSQYYTVFRATLPPSPPRNMFVCSVGISKKK